MQKSDPCTASHEASGKEEEAEGMKMARHTMSFEYKIGNM